MTALSWWEGVFGLSADTQCFEALAKMAEIALEAARRLHKSRGADIDGIVELEHRGDQIVRDEIYPLIDSALFLRMDKPDIARLASSIDDVLDEIRKIANHIAAHELGSIPETEDASELLKLIVVSATKVNELVVLLSKGRRAFDDINSGTEALGEFESEADSALRRLMTALVKEYRGAENKDPIEYLLLEQLYKMLEKVTDHTEDCGDDILTIARKGVK